MASGNPRRDLPPKKILVWGWSFRAAKTIRIRTPPPSAFRSRKIWALALADLSQIRWREQREETRAQPVSMLMLRRHSLATEVFAWAVSIASIQIEFPKKTKV